MTLVHIVLKCRAFRLRSLNDNNNNNNNNPMQQTSTEGVQD